MVLLPVIGRKGSGKSQVLETLIALLNQREYRIGVIKHLAKEGVEIDDPEKDTFRYRLRGAETVMLAGSKRLALFSNLEKETPLEKLLIWFEDYDLVLLDGYFLDYPTLEIYKKDLGFQPLVKSVKNIFALCADEPTGLECPHFPFGQLQELASFIEEKLINSPALILPLSGGGKVGVKLSGERAVHA